MPQEFQILRCFSCETYQVHIVKKANKKWTCKLCGEKQSTIKIFGTGSAKDCRIHVQKLNLARGEKVYGNLHEDYEDPAACPPPAKRRNTDGGFEHKILNPHSSQYCDSNIQEPSVQQEQGVSKWTSYLSNEDEDKELADTYPEMGNINFGMEEEQERESFKEEPKLKRQRKQGFTTSSKQQSRSGFIGKNHYAQDHIQQQATWEAPTTKEIEKSDKPQKKWEDFNESWSNNRCKDSELSNMPRKPCKTAPTSKWSSYVEEHDNDEGSTSFVSPETCYSQPEERSMHEIKRQESESKTIPSAGNQGSKWAAFLDDEEEEAGALDWNL